MTDKQIQAIRRQYNIHTLEHCEADIRSYMNSCLIYDEDYFESVSYCPSTYHKKMHIVHADELRSYGVKDPEKRIKELYNEQEITISKAIITRNTTTDSEGCTYNSCKFEDD